MPQLFTKQPVTHCVLEIQPSELLYSEKLQPRQFNVNLQSIYSASLALVGIIVTLPLMALAAALLKLSSKNPVLLGEQRVGMRGIRFTMYRFRWMEIENGIQCAKPIGSFYTSFDWTLYRVFFNVLRGEMSIVGPRAHRPEFATRLSQIIRFY